MRFRVRQRERERNVCEKEVGGGSRLGGKTQSIKDRLERAWRGCGVFLVVKSYVGTSRRRSLQLQLRVTLILKAGPQKSLGRDTLSVRDNAREREKNKQYHGLMVVMLMM